MSETDRGSTADIALFGKGHRPTQDLGEIPDSSGQGNIGYNTVARNYIAFIYNPVQGQEQANTWQLYLWDRRADRLRQVARNPVDAHGQPLPSNFVLPKLTNRYLYWIQASRKHTAWGGSEVMQYDLQSGRTRTLYRGLADAIVPYHTMLLYTGLVPHPPKPKASDTGAPMRMYALDQTSGKPVSVPGGITAATDRANSIVTDGDIIVWNTDLTIRAWRPQWGRSITLVPSFVRWPEGKRTGAGDGPGYPRLYDHFLSWAADSAYVLDLTTNTFTQLAPLRSAAEPDMSGSALALSEHSHPAHNADSKFGDTEYVLNMRGLPRLPRCRR